MLAENFSVRKVIKLVVHFREYSSVRQSNSLWIPSAPLLPNLHHWLCQDPKIFIITHLTGPGITGKLAHLPPSNSLSRLNHNRGSTFVTCIDFMLWLAVCSASGFGSKSPYWPSVAIFGGSCARWIARASLNESRILISCVPEYEAGAARETSI